MSKMTRFLYRNHCRIPSNRERWSLVVNLAIVYHTVVAINLAATDLPDWKTVYAPRSDAWKSIKQIFVLNNGAEPQSLDPALITGVPESRIVGALFEGMVDLDPKTLEPRPGLAERWTVSDDRLIYTFYLRRNAKWSDGSSMTANEVLQSWQRVLTPETGAAYAYQLFPIANAREFYRREVESFDAVGVEVVDALTLKVRLHSPCPYFLDLVAFHTLFPVPIKVIVQHGERWTRPEHMVSNGPFKLQEWLPRQKIVVSKNEHYWDRDFCKLESVFFLPYDELNTAYQLFLQDKIDWLPDIPIAKLDEITRHPDYYVMPYLGTYFYRFNVTRPPFNDRRVRQAFSLAVDRTIITNHVLKGGQQPATWFCPPTGGYQPVTGLAYNREKARELLQAAGYGDARPFPDVELLYNTSEAHKKIAEALAQQWKHNLGINVILRNTEWKILLSEMDSMNYQMVRSSWVGDYGDPNTFFDMWVTDGGNNRTGWSHKPYDDLLRQSQLETDPARRNSIFQDMERILVEKEFPILPLYIYVKQGMISESVMGWYENNRDIHPLKYIWLEE